MQARRSPGQAGGLQVGGVGLGLRLPLASFAVGLAETASLTVGGTDCVLRRLPPENGWHLAVCAVGKKDFVLQTVAIKVKQKAD